MALYGPRRLQPVTDPSGYLKGYFEESQDSSDRGVKVPVGLKTCRLRVDLIMLDKGRKVNLTGTVRAYSRASGTWERTLGQLGRNPST